jgi:hypothetical protein
LHLVLEVPDGLNSGVIMRFIKARFARRWNHRIGSSGSGLANSLSRAGSDVGKGASGRRGVCACESCCGRVRRSRRGLCSLFSEGLA